MSFLTGSDTVASSGINLAQKFTGPKKLRTSAADSGYRASVTAPTFSWVGPIPSVKRCPMNSSSDMWNLQFSLFSDEPFFLDPL